MSELGSDEYLMPCVLPIEETPCCNPEPGSQSVPAMVVEFPGGPMLGLFCGLVCYLMNTAKWTLAEQRGVPIHITRSSIHFNIPDFPGKITFNDPLSTFFTLTFHGPVEDAPEVCPLIRETILTGIGEVSRNLNYLPQGKASSSGPEQNEPSITFLCSCNITPLHPAAMSRNGKRLLHADNAQIYANVTNQHRVWLMNELTGQHQQPVKTSLSVGHVSSSSVTASGNIAASGGTPERASGVPSPSSPALKVSPPSLGNLSLLKWKDDNGKTHRFKLLGQVSSKWWDAGLRLGLNADELANIKQKTDDNEQRLAFIFTQWINNDGHPPDYPLSWDGVWELLCDLDRDSAAKELQQALKHCNLLT